jgi:putative flavoprotein involved in K+ transport
MVTGVADQTVIIGAGPAGLAVAATLAQRGIQSVVLEQADSAAPSWRSRYDGLRLHTVRWLSGMPGAPMPRRLGPWVRRDDFVGYLEDYARRFGIEPEFGVEVLRIERDPAGWRVETSRGVRHAPTVVVATGYCREPRIPDWPGIESFPGSFVHSAAYREPSGYAGQAVLVVGAGNSAAEIAVEVAGVATEVRLSVRTPPNIVRRDTLGIPSQLAGLAMRRLPERALDPLVGTLRRLTVPDLTGAGLPAPPGDGFTQFLRSKTIPILDHGFVDAVRDGRIRVVAEIESVSGQDVRLVDGTSMRADAIVAATGYRPDLRGLVGDLDVLDDTGAPRVHGPQEQPQAPGLYFVGISVQLSGQLHDIAHEAEAVSKAIKATSM